LNRWLGDVLDAMLALIPSEETALRAKLSSVRYDCGYRAPETMRYLWMKTARVLESHFGHDPAALDGWRHQVVTVFTGGNSVVAAMLRTGVVAVARKP
jgi:hypothetical protein